MAITVAGSPRDYDVVGRKVQRTLRVTFDSSYPTGGESFDATSYGVPNVQTVRCTIHSTHGYTVTYDASNKKLVVWCSGEKEVADTTSLATLVVDVTLIGD